MLQVKSGIQTEFRVPYRLLHAHAFYAVGGRQLAGGRSTHDVPASGGSEGDSCWNPHLCPNGPSLADYPRLIRPDVCPQKSLHLADSANL